MNYPARAFQISFLLHSLIFALILLLSTYIAPTKKLIIVDFNLQKAESPAKKTEPSLNPGPKPKPKGLKRNELPPLLEEKPRQSLSPEVPPVVKLPEADSLSKNTINIEMADSSKAVKEGAAGVVGGSREGIGKGQGDGVDGGKGSAETWRESVKAKYLREHFAYIRDKILKNISYPLLARRKGWEGKVQISFVITSDGGVKEVKIIQGSGYDILDRNAEDTVKDSAPFPKPPVEARLIIPIIYRLD